jgi:LacI family transcriptional regulator
MTRLVDVAKRAGVSKSTASNVIRGGALVAEATRARVERAIAETGYLPNAIARSLKVRASKVLAIVVPDLTNPFHAELTVRVERAANALGYAVLTVHTHCQSDVELEAGCALIERRVDGVIISGISPGSELPGLLLNREIPVALASLGEPDDPRLGIVDTDDSNAMEEIVEHLYALGHRAMAFSAQELREHSGTRRRTGFQDSLARRGLAPVALEEGATAIVAHNDMQAISMIDRLERQGWRVPDDVSIVGFDDIPLASHCRIQLTTVRSDAVQMGRRAVELVVEAARLGRHIGHREVQTNPLVIRATTGRPVR